MSKNPQNDNQFFSSHFTGPKADRLDFHAQTAQQYCQNLAIYSGNIGEKHGGTHPKGGQCSSDWWADCSLPEGNFEMTTKF